MYGHVLNFNITRWYQCKWRYYATNSWYYITCYIQNLCF